MELNKLVDVYIANTISIGHHKGFVTHIFLHSFDTATGHSVITSIYNCDLPGLQFAVMYSHFVLSVTEVKAYITIMQEVVGEPFFDVFLFVTGTNDKFIVPVIGIFLHDMPKNRHTTYFNHGFGLINRFLRDTGTKAAG